MYGMTETMINKAKYKVKCNKAFMASHGIELDDKIIPFKDFVSNSYVNSDRYIAELQHRSHSSYRKINKDDRCYFRVTEPHKNGTPHLHISFFMPKENTEAFVNSINRLFPAPASKIVLDVDSPVHYLMKYILKTLDDLRGDSDKLTALTLWYIYHGISRFYTSRTFVALDIYRKLNGMYTLNELKTGHDNQEISIFYYSGTKEIASICNEFGIIYIPKSRIGAMSIKNWEEKMEEYEFMKSIDPSSDLEIPVPQIVDIKNPQWRQDMENEDNTYYEYEFEPIKMVHKTPMVTYLEQDNKKYIVNQGSIKEVDISCPLTGEVFVFDLKQRTMLKEIKKKPYQMSDMSLLSHFDNLDIDAVNPHYYANTHNIMLERGLIDGQRLKLDEFNEVGEVF